MGLNARERQALRSIEGGLADSDPDLVSHLANLSRLMAGEDKPAAEPGRRGTERSGPAAERGRPGWRKVFSSVGRWLPGSRRRGHTGTHSAWGSAILVLWLAISCALIATAATLSHVGASGACGGLVAVPCGSRSPVPPHAGAR